MSARPITAIPGAHGASPSYSAPLGVPSAWCVTPAATGQPPSRSPPRADARCGWEGGGPLRAEGTEPLPGGQASHPLARWRRGGERQVTTSLPPTRRGCTGPASLPAQHLLLLCPPTAACWTEPSRLTWAVTSRGRRSKGSVTGPATAQESTEALLSVPGEAGWQVAAMRLPSGPSVQGQVGSGPLFCVQFVGSFVLFYSHEKSMC